MMRHAIVLDFLPCLHTPHPHRPATGSISANSLPLSAMYMCAASKLGEANGQAARPDKIIPRGIKSLAANGVVIDRDWWLKVRGGAAQGTASALYVRLYVCVSLCLLAACLPACRVLLFFPCRLSSAWTALLACPAAPAGGGGV